MRPGFLSNACGVLRDDGCVAKPWLLCKARVVLRGQGYVCKSNSLENSAQMLRNR